MQALTRAGAAAAARVASVPLPSTATSFRAYSRVPKTPLAQAYHLVLKRNSTYLLFIVGGAVILESIYGTVGDAVWSAANHGKTYETMDWSKFETIVADEDDDDEDEDEEDDE